MIGAAIMVAKIATGEIAEPTVPGDGKDPAAKALGKKDGAARAMALTPEQRAEIAKKAAGSCGVKRKTNRHLTIISLFVRLQTAEVLDEYCSAHHLSVRRTDRPC